MDFYIIEKFCSRHPEQNERFRSVTLTFVFATLLSLAITGSALADRDDFVQAYEKHNSSVSSLLQSAPLHHIIPSPQEITIAADVDLVDIIIGPEGSGIGTGTGADDLTHKLEMTGYDARPFLAFSIKKFGIAFMAEVGRKQILYKREAQTITDSLGNQTSLTYEENLADVRYSGFGIFGFANLRLKRTPRWLKPTVIVGIRTLQAEHKSWGIRTTEFEIPDPTVWRYNVQIAQAGANLGINFMRSFTIRPWVDWSQTTVGQPSSPSSTSSTSNSSIAADPLQVVVESDQELIFNSQPQTLYGIDLLLDMKGVQVQFGGLLGALAGLYASTDRIYDRTYSIGLGYSFKAR